MPKICEQGMPPNFARLASIKPVFGGVSGLVGEVRNELNLSENLGCVAGDDSVCGGNLRTAFQMEEANSFLTVNIVV